MPLAKGIFAQIAARRLAMVALLLGITVIPGSRAAGARNGSSSGSQPPPCGSFTPLYEHLDADLAAWGGARVKAATLDALQAYVDANEDPDMHRYLTRVAVVGGRVYLRRPLQRPLGGEGARLAAMLADIVDAVAAAEDPAALGNSEFFLHMGDKPVVLRGRPDAFPLPVAGVPVLSHCTGDRFGDIAVPIYDYRCGARSSVDSLYAWRAGGGVPAWADRLPVAMGRWTQFCANESVVFPDRPGLPCPRAHLDALASADPSGALDLGSTHNYSGYPVAKAFLPMRAQMDGFKYVVTPDGWTCSSKFDKLLLSGAVVLKQDSAARGWFYRALAEGHHYLPFFKHPDDLPAQVAWLRGHDTEAARVADAGRAFAERYMSKRARNCFMQRVLQGLAARMGFDVRCDDGGGAPCVRAEEELTAVAVEALYMHTCDVTLV